MKINNNNNNELLTWLVFWPRVNFDKWTIWLLGMWSIIPTRLVYNLQIQTKQRRLCLIMAPIVGWPLSWLLSVVFCPLSVVGCCWPQSNQIVAINLTSVAVFRIFWLFGVAWLSNIWLGARRQLLCFSSFSNAFR